MEADGTARGGSGGNDASGPPRPQDRHASAPDTEVFLSSLAALLIQKAPPAEMAALVLEAAKRLTTSPHGYVAYLDPASGKLVCPALTAEVWERCQVAGRKINLESFQGLLGWVRQHRQPLISNHPASDPRARGVPDGHVAITRVLSVPVLKGDALLGQISLANSPRDYTAQDQTNLERLAELLGLALRRALDEMELERTCRELDAKVLEHSGHLDQAARSLQRERLQRLRAERELESFFQTAPDLMVMLSPEGRLQRVSPSSRKILGLPPAKLVGRMGAELIHPDDLPLLRRHMEEMRGGGSVIDQELRLRRRDGSWAWISWSAMPSPDGQVFYGAGRDISRRKALEQALRESNESFRLIFEQSPVGAALLSPDHRYARVNQEYCRFLGRGTGELARLPFQEVSHPDEVPLDLECLRALQSGEAESCVREKRYLRGDGQTVWGRMRASLVRDAQGRPLHALTLVEDITQERQEGQRRLLDEQRQAALLTLHGMSDSGVQEICDFALEEGVRLTGSEMGYLYFLSEDETTLSVFSWSRGVRERCQVPGQPEVYQVADTGLWGEAVRQRRPIVTNDYAAANPHKRGLPEGHPPLRRHMNVPLLDGGRIVAVAGVANKPTDYDEGDVAMLQLLMGGMWGVARRRRDQEALRASETLFRQMFETNRSVKLLLDPADGSIVRANQAACQFYGYSPEEFAAKKITDINLLTPEQIQREMVRAAREERLYFEFPHRLASGEVRQVEVYSGPVTMEGRQLLYSIVHDVTARKRTEQALRESEEKFAKAFQAGPVFMTITSLEDGRILEANQAICQALGYDRRELLGRTTVEIGMWGDAGERPALADAVRGQGRVKELEVAIHGRGGRSFQVLLSAERIQLAGEDCLLGVAMDITARQRTERALQESEERFRLAFESSPMGVALIDRQGRFQEVNASLCAMLGYTSPELLQLTFADITHPDDRAASREGFQRMLEGPDSHLSMEKRYLRRDGGVLWGLLTTARVVNERGDMLYLISQVIDITARKQAEHALRESEEKFAKAFRAGPVYMVISDLADGRILEVNEAFAKALGYPREEIIGTTAAELNIWRDPRQRQEMIAAVLRDGSAHDLEAEAHTRDGRTITSLVSAERIQVGGRECLLGVALDISQRKALEEQARQSLKRESLAIMAGGVAHDFNNLLQSILGNTDLALLDLLPQSPPADNLREVQAAAQRAAGLAHKMLAYSGHTPYIPRPLDLSALVRQSLPLLRQDLPSWIRLEHALPSGLPALEGDPALLRQALQNLVANAVEALDANPGAIFIATGARHCDPALLESTYLGRGLTPGEYAYLRVEDTGPGMDAETAGKAFDPFFTTKFPGRGLGLAVVLGVVRAHRGAVRIEPRPGGGSMVSLYLPVERPAPAPARAPEEKPGTGPRLVLLVDDEEAVRTVARRMLEKHGFTVLTAGNGSQALDLLARRGGEVGVVLLDLNMPGTSGEALVRRMLELETGARMVVSSSLERREAEASLGSCAIAGFIQKPYRMASLIASLRQALGIPTEGA